MNVNCSTCLELLTPSDDLSCPPCGHAFHTVCIEQCIENTKKCPLCRALIRSNSLRRIYLTQGADLSESQADSTVLQSRVDQLIFDKRLLEAEKKKAVEGCEKATVQAVALREEVRSLESRLSYAKEETQSYKAQNSLMMGEKKKADKAKKEAAELREKLALFKNIEMVVNGSSGEVNQKLHQMGDYSKTSKDLSYMMISLRKELDAKSKEASQYRKESESRHSRLIEARASLEMAKQSNDALTSDKVQLTEDNNHLEAEVDRLKAKVTSLQEAISSPSGDPKQSVINRLMAESPAPASRLLMQEVTPNENRKRRFIEESPDVASSQFGAIMDLKKTKSFHEGEPFKDSTNQTKKSLSQQQPTTTMMGQSKKTSLLLKNVPKFRDLVTSSPSMTSSNGMDYDGYGGRSRPDQGFPVRKINAGAATAVNKSKKPKGVSRPKQNNLKPSEGIKSIDSFFSSLES